MKETTLTGESKDILNENIETLKELFPEIVSEDKIDFDKFKTIFGGEIDDSSERYSFTWPGKTQAIKESQKQSTGTLRPCKEESKNWDTTKNLYIEGDNLEVLKLLQKTYYNKIKMIYIDPPYNTGNDFVYKDDYVDNLENYLEISGQKSDGQRLTTNTESDGRYHSNWLNMMYPRLKLARNLLLDDGVIFISIDDNEVENLKKLCDEIFGEENLVCTITREAIKGGSISKNIRNVVDYVLCYSKNINFVQFGGIKTNGITLNLEDKHGKYAKGRELNKWGAGSRREDSPSMFYPIPGPNGEDVYPIRNDGSEGRWRLGKEKMFNLLKEDNAIFEKRKDGTFIVYEKLRDDSPRIKQFTNLFTEKYINSKGTEELKSLFKVERAPFDFAKPTNLIYDLMLMADVKDDIVLDFFSGSSTTAHAVLLYNNKENISNNFIMIQIPEKTSEISEAHKLNYKNLCEIGKDRIRKSGDAIINESKNNKLDIGFKVFKLDKSNLNKWDPDYDNLEQTLLVSQDNIKPDRTQEDLIYEIMLKYGIDLTLPIEEYDAGENKIYSIGFGALLICLDNKITKDIADSIIELASEDVSRVVFKDNGFASDADKTNIKETLRTHGIDEFITI